MRGPAGWVQRLRTGRRSWRLLVPVVCLAAGLLFAVAARSPRVTTLRTPGTTSNLAALVRTAERQVQDADRTVTALQAQVTAATRLAGSDNSAVSAAQATSRAAAATGRPDRGLRPRDHGHPRRRGQPGRPAGRRSEPAGGPPVRPAVGRQRALGRRRRGDDDRGPARHRDQRGALRREHPAAERQGVLAAVPGCGDRAVPDNEAAPRRLARACDCSSRPRSTTAWATRSSNPASCTCPPTPGRSA